MEGLCSAEVRTPDPPLLQQIQEDVSSFFSPPLFFEAKQRELFLPLGCITEQQEEQQALCATVCRLQSGGQIEGWMDRERGERESGEGGREREHSLFSVYSWMYSPVAAAASCSGTAASMMPADTETCEAEEEHLYCMNTFKYSSKAGK